MADVGCGGVVSIGVCRFKMGLKLHRREYLWVRKVEKGYFYFSLEKWMFRKYRTEWRREDFFELEDVVARRKLRERNGWR